MTRKAFIVVLLILVCSSLALAEIPYQVKYSTEVAVEVRQSVQALESKIFASFQNNDPATMFNLYSVEAKKTDTLEDVKATYNLIRSEVSNFNLQQVTDYYVEFDTKEAKVYPSDLVDVSMPPQGTDNFIIALKMQPAPTYVSLYKTTTGLKDMMFSFVWVQEGGNWRLQWFNIGLYQLMGKTGYDWFTSAKMWAQKGYDAPAMMYMAISTMLMSPAPFFSYKDQYEAMALVNTVQSNIVESVSFPLLFPQIKSKPQVYNIEPQLLRDGLYPGIQYVTTIALSDTAALQKEVDALAKELESVFPGITQMASHIVFHAFSEAPTDPNKQYRAATLTVQVRK